MSLPGLKELIVAALVVLALVALRKLPALLKKQKRGVGGAAPDAGADVPPEAPV